MKVQILSRLDPVRGRKVDTGLKILELPRKGQHKFRKDFLDRIKAFSSVTDDSIILHTVDGDVRFRIDQLPGTRKCLTTGEYLPSPSEDPKAEKTREIIAKLGGKAVKTERWPQGYVACPPKVYMTTLEA